MQGSNPVTAFETSVNVRPNCDFRGQSGVCIGGGIVFNISFSTEKEEAADDEEEFAIDSGDAAAEEFAKDLAEGTNPFISGCVEFRSSDICCVFNVLFLCLRFGIRRSKFEEG